MSYGPDATFVEVNHTCNSCGLCADFTGENDAVVKAAIEKSEAAAAESILRWFSENGVPAVHFERVLRLPMRTTQRWKSGEVSAAALALLRLTRTYPWLLDVADSNYDEHVAIGALIEAAGHAFRAGLCAQFKGGSIAVTQTATQVNINAELYRHEPVGPPVFTGTDRGQVYIQPLAPSFG